MPAVVIRATQSAAGGAPSPRAGGLEDFDFGGEKTIPQASPLLDALDIAPDPDDFHDPADTLPPEVARRLQDQMKFEAAARGTSGASIASIGSTRDTLPGSRPGFGAFDDE